jgi:aspartate/methionine/tyrosine aminotransferase
VLLVQGSGFNWIAPDHFRVVFLPNSDDLIEAIGRIARFWRVTASVTAPPDADSADG